MIPDEYRGAASNLSKALRASPSIYSLGTGSTPLWFGFSLTEILLLANDSEIRYATGTYHSSTSSARLLAMTSGLLIESTVTEIQEADGKRLVKAVRRSGIRSVSVEAGETPFSEAAFSDWPGDLVVRAEFEGLSSPAIFPLERTQSSDSSIRELLRTLLTDLSVSG